jgi:hypothetical protein
MGRDLRLGHILVEIEKDNFVEDLINLFDFDEDINGNNGEEFTRTEALENGFNSTAEWVVTNSIEAHGQTKIAISGAIDSIFEEEDYYPEYKYGIVELKDRFWVSLAYTS